MKIIETRIFTKRLKALLTDEDYRSLQNALIRNPEKGNLISGTGGLRKIRFGIQERGKSGGARVIYYWAKAKKIIVMLLIYSKNEQDDLSPEQKKILRNLVKEEFE